MKLKTRRFPDHILVGNTTLPLKEGYDLSEVRQYQFGDDC